MTFFKQKKDNGFSLTELVAVLALIGAMLGLSLVVFRDQVIKAQHKKDVNTDAIWLQSIQNKAAEQNRICAIRIIKSTTPNNADIAQAYTGFTSIASNEYCTGIAPHRFNSKIQQLAVGAQNLNSVCPSDSNNLYLIFPPSGAVPCGGEILLESEPLRDGSTKVRCLNILPPLGIFREGIQIGGTCDYTNAF